MRLINEFTRDTDPASDRPRHNFHISISEFLVRSAKFRVRLATAPEHYASKTSGRCGVVRDDPGTGKETMAYDNISSCSVIGNGAWIAGIAEDNSVGWVRS
jgi:hypothetical protein